MALHPHRYLDLLDADARRMAAIAPANLEAPVPSCPGWDVAEVMRHTASVYGHKVGTIRLGRPPKDGEWRTHPPAGADLVEWFSSTFASLMEELASHDPDDWASTWWPGDQTMHFWYRRMALETVVHRVDVESAAGELSALDADLSSEGIDEVLTVFLGVRDRGAAGARSGVVAVAADGRGWTLKMDERSVRVEPGETAAATARLRGDATPLFLYLWGRGPLDGLGADGDTALITQLRSRLAAATQ